MTESLFCLLTGYLLGSVNPSAMLSKIKKRDLREHGTGNLGAMNTFINFGKAWGAFVMIFDIMKALIAIRIAKTFVPNLLYAGYLAGGAAVIGHMFPFYLKFKGGKGLAPFAGFVLGNHPYGFLFLFVLGIVLMVTVNYSVAMPLSVSAFFPFLAGYAAEDITVFWLTLFISILMIIKFHGNLLKAIRGEDVKVRDFIRAHFSK